MQVYDDFLKPEIAQEAYEFVLKSYYQIGWEDSLVPEQRTYPNLHSRYNSEDIKKLNILGPIHKKLKNKNLICDKCIVNLTKPLDINFIHSHPNQVVALYYPNLTWKPEDGGETLFYKNNKRDILLAETDWMGNSDVTMSNDWKTYRQALRDITKTEPVDMALSNITFPTKPS